MKAVWILCLALCATVFYEVEATQCCCKNKQPANNGTNTGQYPNKGNETDTETYPNKGNETDTETYPNKGNETDTETYPNKGNETDTESYPNKGNETDTAYPDGEEEPAEGETEEETPNVGSNASADANGTNPDVYATTIAGDGVTAGDAGASADEGSVGAQSESDAK